jgi:hypothetical protein
VTPIERPAAENFHAPDRGVGGNIVGNFQPGDEMTFMGGRCFCQAAMNSAVQNQSLSFGTLILAAPANMLQAERLPGAHVLLSTRKISFLDASPCVLREAHYVLK